MTDGITLEKLKIHDAHGGDLDAMCRNGRTSGREVFGQGLETTWALISSRLQDMELISKRLASYPYTKSILTELHRTTDAATFSAFTDRIPFHADFQKVREILEAIKSRTTDETDTAWAGYDNGTEFLADLTADIEKIRFYDRETLEKIHLEFAPTSTYQELSWSNGWGDEFLKLAARFDKLYEKIKSREAHGNKRQGWKLW